MQGEREREMERWRDKERERDGERENGKLMTWADTQMSLSCPRSKPIGWLTLVAVAPRLLTGRDTPLDLEVRR